MRRLSPAALALLLGLAARALLLVVVPENYSFDAYQRWAGREHLFVRDWLPGPQLLVWGLAPLGVWAVKLAFAVTGALGAMAAAALAERLGGREAGLATAALGVFGPALAWTVVPYQEGPYLALLMGGLALALSGGRRAERAGDLLIGALALVRYEGWPFIGLYLLWRRSPRALLSLWGVAVWALFYKLGWTQGYAPSPVDYADWAGLGERFSLGAWAGDVGRGLEQAAQSGGLLLLVAGLVGAYRCRERRGVGLLTLALVGQLVITGLWIAGLEAATVRMQVVPGALLAVLGGLLAAQLERRRAVGVAVLLFGAWGLASGLNNALDSARGARPEQRLAEQMARCEGCVFRITPRAGLGTRDRHDGCEILQGITDWTAGVDFTCASWPGPPLGGINWEAVWREGGYQITEITGPGS